MPSAAPRTASTAAATASPRALHRCRRHVIGTRTSASTAAPSHAMTEPGSPSGHGLATSTSNQAPATAAPATATATGTHRVHHARPRRSDSRTPRASDVPAASATRTGPWTSDRPVIQCQRCTRGPPRPVGVTVPPDPGRRLGVSGGPPGRGRRWARRPTVVGPWRRTRPGWGHGGVRTLRGFLVGLAAGTAGVATGVVAGPLVDDAVGLVGAQLTSAEAAGETGDFGAPLRLDSHRVVWSLPAAPAAL